MMQSAIYGRKSEDGSVQPLQDHLLGAGVLAQSFEQEYRSLAYATAVLHDIGKASDDFQQYLLNGEGKRGSVHHAIHGAVFAQQAKYQTSRARVFANAIIALAVARHHGELPDCIFDEPDAAGARSIFEVFSGKIPEIDQRNFKQVLSRLNMLHIDFDDILRQAADSVTEFIEACPLYKGSVVDNDQQGFYFGLFLKYIYSRLVDADRLDAAAFTLIGEQRDQHLNAIEPDWQSFIHKLSTFTEAFDTTSPINRVRTSIYRQCQQSSHKETGIYQLAVPTGGGKTLASLNFALHHAKQWKKKRIIYVIPYLSITTQTAQVFRSVFDLDAENSVLLEHYSSADSYNTITHSDNNAVRDQSDIQSDNESLLAKLAAERWDNPLIVTTMVQFLETVMAAQGTKLRKFHNMADSIIIFDEIQALPTNTIHLFNEIVSFLSHILHTTIVLCSATQPHLGQSRRHNLALSDNPDLVHLSEKEREVFRRTQIIASSKRCSIEELADHIWCAAQTYGNCLAIVNLKSEARKVLAILKEKQADEKFTLVHLSTNMCNAHRADCIAKLHQQLTSDHARVICVSTQLIEAGVDISFNSVVRAAAGLDSIIQAAGRCNRNGTLSSKAPVFVYPLENENLHNLPAIDNGKNISMQLLREKPDIDLLSSQAIDMYYNMLFHPYSSSEGSHSIMDYPFTDCRLGKMYAYTALGWNTTQRADYNNNFGDEYIHPFAQAFSTVGRNFHVISNAGQSIVVPYREPGEAGCKPLELLEQLDQLPAEDKTSRLAIVRQLQPYTVTVFDYEMKQLKNEGALCEQKVVPNGSFSIRYIDSAHYNDEVGITYEITSETIIC